MEHELKWETNMHAALNRSRRENKPVLLEFFNPQCIGCMQMEEVTFPNAKVTQFINDNLTPLRLQYDGEPFASDYNIKWTPTILTLDHEGKEHHRMVGFLPPEEFLPALLLGIDKMYFDTDKLDDAVLNLTKLMSDYPNSTSTPEAIFLRGVSMYKNTHNTKSLKDAYEKLQSEYPASEWTKRANPYRLL